MQDQSKQTQVKAKTEHFFAEMKDVYEKVFGSPSGQKVLEDIKKSGGIGKTSFNPDGMVMAHTEGKRALALHINFMATAQETKEPETAIK